MDGTKSDGWDEVRGWAVALVLLVPLGALFWYMTNAPYEVYEIQLFDGSLSLVVLVVLVVFILLTATSALDQFNLHGPLPVAVADGHAWRRSIRSRHTAFANLGWLIFGHRVFFMPHAAWQHQDWPRLAVSGLVVVGVLYLVQLALRTALGWGLVLAIDSDGVRGLGVPGGAMRWHDIERLSVGGRLEAREVTIFARGADGRLGKAHSLDLSAAGISARAFVDMVAELAPGLEITWPASRMADFTAA